MNEVLKAIEARSSTRGYTKERLTDEELNILLTAGLQAPTAANRPEVHITALRGDDPILAEIEAEMRAGMDRQWPQTNFYYDAPTVLILSADAAFPWGALDAGIMVENIAIAAEGIGLGSLIIGIIKKALTGERAAEFAEKLRFPEGYAFQIAIAVGHKATAKAPHEYSFEKSVTVL